MAEAGGETQWRCLAGVADGAVSVLSFFVTEAVFAFLSTDLSGSSAFCPFPSPLSCMET